MRENVNRFSKIFIIDKVFRLW